MAGPREGMLVRDLERGRRPASVGARRCWRCTVINLALVGLLAGGAMVALEWHVGVAAALVGVGLVWWRGYLVPGTPWLAERVLPSRVRAWFGPDPPLAILYRHGVIDRRHDGSLGFDPAFLDRIEGGRDAEAIDRSALDAALASRLPARYLEADTGARIVDFLASALAPCPRCGTLDEAPFGGCCGNSTARRCAACRDAGHPSDGRNPSRAP